VKFLRVLAALLAACAVSVGAGAADAPRVLRYSFLIAETGFDPAQVQDLYSRIVTSHLFDGLYHYDHLARPFLVRPNVAVGMPEVSDDFKTWTVHIKPGIYFSDDPAFKGKKRELVAQDYVYQWKRFFDPAVKSPAYGNFKEENVIGVEALREAALKPGAKFDYDREIEGIRALDRYTIRFKLEKPRPRFLYVIAQGDLFGAVAREVVEFYGADIMAHPVGTGPFRLAQWRRSSLIVLERNPNFREVRYEDEVQPNPDDAEGQALLAKFKGRRLPMIDRVEISIIEEEQPRWLSFVNGEADLAYRVGYQFVNQAMPNGKVAPNLAKRGIHGYRVVDPAGNYYFFNMEDATVGGYGPEKVALRRAIALGLDSKTIIDYAYSGLGAVAQGPTLPFTSGYDPSMRSEFGDYDPARAKALLDLYGYKDREGDGWREMPDGSPLLLRVNTQADQRSRKIIEIFSKSMKALGIRVQVVVAQWPENLKAGRAGKLQMWFLGGYASAPDAEGSYARLDSRQIGGQNMSRVKLPALDALYDKIQRLPDGEERVQAFKEAHKIALAYMPYKFTLNRLSLDMTQPQLIGYRRPVFWLDFWQYVDIDDSLRIAR